jgi:hypothetical protein
MTSNFQRSAQIANKLHMPRGPRVRNANRISHLAIRCIGIVLAVKYVQLNCIYFVVIVVDKLNNLLDYMDRSEALVRLEECHKMKCECGCGRSLVAATAGRPRRSFSAACRQKICRGRKKTENEVVATPIDRVVPITRKDAALSEGIVLALDNQHHPQPPTVLGTGTRYPVRRRR